MIALYKIAGIVIGLNTPFVHEDDEAFGRYRVSEDCIPDISVSFHCSAALPDLTGEEVLFQNPLNRIVRCNDQILHLFSLPGISDAIAWKRVGDVGEKTVDIYYSEAILPYFQSTVGCFNAISIERILASFGLLIFHCCYICRNDEAILFSAPSGGGKSTQGHLWEESGKGRVINGDRAVLERREDGKWIAHGLPIAGSSGVFNNESFPVRAILFVEKAERNQVVQLNVIRRFTNIYGQLVSNNWDRDFQEMVMNAAEQLSIEVPVAKLECTISQEAVNKLEAYLL